MLQLPNFDANYYCQTQNSIVNRRTADSQNPLIQAPTIPYQIRFTRASTTNMSMHAAGDIPIQITSENSSSERRITPTWTIGQLKAKLEAVTGIPPLSQKLTLRLGSQQSVPIEAVDEENTQLGVFPLAPYAEIHVSFEFIDVRFAKHVVILCLLACSDS